jgi:hypothetical protein
MRHGFLALLLFCATALPAAAQGRTQAVGDYDSWGRPAAPIAYLPDSVVPAVAAPAAVPYGTLQVSAGPGPVPGGVIPLSPTPPSLRPTAPATAGPSTHTPPAVPVDAEPESPPQNLPYQFAKPDYRVWYTAEYLLWFVRGDPSHFPLVTTDTNPGTLVAGTLASPTAGVLIGGSDIGYHGLSGTRQTLGAWLDNEQSLGVELSGLVLAQTGAGFGAASNAFGNPALYLPAFNVATGRENALILADPVLRFAGDVAINSSLSLWGMEVDSIWNVARSEGWNLNLATGFRYLDLNENLTLQAASVDLTTGNMLSLTDSFQTRNEFYGWQLAARASYTYGPITMRLSAETAFGTTRQIVTITGNSTLTGAAPFNGGFFAEPSNSGQQLRNTFTVVPHVAGRFDYHITQWLTLFAGYDFLYWSSVVRPGDQIDRGLNLTQNPILSTGTLVGAARPTPLFARTDFIATGLTCGLQLIY